jgi:pimeloyl-ACP methyl ester carboxylesterase
MNLARELLAEATPRTLALPGRGIEIALLDWGGDGPLAVLHHANGFCKGLWAPVAHELRYDFRLVAMDARGHGDSGRPEPPSGYGWTDFADDLGAVAAHLAEEAGTPVALGLGHSFGGTSMLGAAARHPDLFERLVLVDPVVPPSPAVVPPPERGAHVAELVERAGRRRAHWESREEARAWWAERALFADWRPEALDLYALDGLRPAAGGGFELKCPGAVEAAVFGNSGQVDVDYWARRVDAPTLWLWASKGNFDRATYEGLAAVMDEGRVATIDAGHLAPMERPEVVVEAVRAG